EDALAGRPCESRVWAPAAAHVSVVAATTAAVAKAGHKRGMDHKWFWRDTSTSLPAHSPDRGPHRTALLLCCETKPHPRERQSPLLASRDRLAAMTKSHTADGVILFTGFPGFIGARLLPRLLELQPDVEFRCLVQERFLEAARSSIEEIA